VLRSVSEISHFFLGSGYFSYFLPFPGTFRSPSSYLLPHARCLPHAPGPLWFKKGMDAAESPRAKAGCSSRRGGSGAKPSPRALPGAFRPEDLRRAQCGETVAWCEPSSPDSVLTPDTQFPATHPGSPAAGHSPQLLCCSLSTHPGCPEAGGATIHVASSWESRAQSPSTPVPILPAVLPVSAPGTPWGWGAVCQQGASWRRPGASPDPYLPQGLIVADGHLHHQGMGPNRHTHVCRVQVPRAIDTS